MAVLENAGRKAMLFCAGALLCAGALPLAAKEYWVSSASQIASAMSTAVPGDTLTMNAGTWTNASILFKGKGTASAPILLRAAAPGGVILTGSSVLRMAGEYLVADGLTFENGAVTSSAVVEFRGTSGDTAHHCRLTNTTIRNYNPANDSTDTKWLSLYGTYNRVDHCWFEGKKNVGTTLVVWLSARPNYHTIDHNYFGPRPPIVLDNGGETIRVGTSDWSMYDSFTTVEYNLFDRCNGEIETISSKSCGNVYRYNTFLECQGTLTLRHGNRCEVYGNFFIQHHVANSGGIRIIGEDHRVYNNYIEGADGSSLKTAITIMNGVPNSPLNRYFQVKRAVVVFNTLVDNRYSMNIGAGKTSELSLPPLDCVIANNIVKGTTGPLVTFTDTPLNMTWSGNIFYGASLGMTTPAGNSVVNPQLVYGTDSLWRPASGSPALGAAAGSYPFVTVDMDGQMRISPFDCGADQRSAETIIMRPMRRADVGPHSEPASVGGVMMPVPDGGALRLSPNYPNPFNAVTTIRYQIRKRTTIRLAVYDALGREIALLASGARMPAEYAVRWNAEGIASGVYYCRLTTDEQSVASKLILLR